MSSSKTTKTTKATTKKTTKKEPTKIVFSDSESDDNDDSDEEVEIKETKDNKEPRTKELEVKCLDLHAQILHRPDTYIGSIKKNKYNDIWVIKEGRFTLTNPTYSEGLLRLFVEVVSNAIDNVWRSREFGITPKVIKIDIDRKNNLISVYNDGKPISTEKHKSEKKYIPELIFSRLLTSTNYDDSENRKTSGRNGVGIKCSNIFSKEFSVELFNPSEQKIYKQTWKDNMYKVDEPEIKTYKNTFPELSKNSGYTKISWIADFKRFDNMAGYDDEIISVIEKYIYDTAMIVSKYNVKVYLNNKLLPISSLKDYALLYLENKEEKESSDNESEEDESSSSDDEESGSDNEKKPKKKVDETMFFMSKDCKVVILPYNKHIAISFVNGICTTEGGVHVDKWVEAIFRPIVDNINGVKKDKDDKKKKEKDDKKKKEQVKIDIRDVKDKFMIFVDAEVNNPEFRGQNKTRLSAPEVEVKVKPADIKKIMKWSVIDQIKNLIDLKNLAELKIKKKGFVKADGLDDANFAKKASAKRNECILCITEGLSAKTYVVQGMKVGVKSRSGTLVKGRDYIGVMPIRGKFINPKRNSIKTVAKNKEVKAIISALGLEVGVDYTEKENLDKLRYGRLIIFADADKDGIHIVGLLYNFFHTLYPSILKVQGFFCFARTPIMKVARKNNLDVFYYLDQAQKFIKENNIKKTDVKYYKGLGTSNDEDIEEDFGKRIAEVKYEDTTDTIIGNIFDNKKEQILYRKDWLTSFDPNKVNTIHYEDGEKEVLPLSKFINEELITFSIEDCKRSIPSLFDGLKESQRKILYAVFKRNLNYSGKSMKLGQLSGYVAEKTNYHHGEDNLIDTIRGMAQRYVGSNNMPYLFNDGQFGSRIVNGADGAAGRYIFTKLEIYTRELFPKEDDDYLRNVEDDGDIVEKEYYLPIIPTILVNGGVGIGTGFSTSVPCYNPHTLIEWIKMWIDDNKLYERLGNGIVINEGPTLTPWYRGFKGTIKVEDDKIYSYGCLENIGKHKWRVTEIPIGKNNYSISKYKKFLEDLVEEKKIKDFEDHTSDNTVDFIIYEDTDGITITLESLNLIDTIHTSNMVLFDGNNRITKYKAVEDILVEFCKKRLELYEVRRKGEIKKLEDELKYNNNKIRFITEINSEKNKLVIMNRDENDLYNEMKKRGYDIKVKETKENKDEEEKEEEDNEEEGISGTLDKGYDYLLNMRIRGATKNKLEELKKEVEKLEEKLKLLRKTKAGDIWKGELDTLEKKFGDWCKTADDKRKGKKDKTTKKTK